MPCQSKRSYMQNFCLELLFGELQKKRNQYFIAKRILNVWMWDWIESCFACYLYPVMIAREKTPDREVKAKTEKAPRNGTKRKIENETEVEMEKKRMIKTNENRYCSIVLLHWEKINAKYYIVCMFDAYYIMHHSGYFFHSLIVIWSIHKRAPDLFLKFMCIKLCRAFYRWMASIKCVRINFLS